MSYKIAVIYGSVRSERQGIKAARFMINKCKEQGWQVDLVDPLEYNLPLIDKMYKEYEKGQVPDNLEKLAEVLRQADGYIVVTGEYNHSLPPALTNMIDYFMPEFFYKPSGIVSYSSGNFAGVRASIQARILLGEVGMSAIPTIFPIAKVQDTMGEDGQAIDKKYDKRVEKFIKEFAWYVGALKIARDKGVPK